MSAPLIPESSSMSLNSGTNSPSHANDQPLEKGDDTPKVIRGAVLFENPRFCMNLISSFDEGKDLNLRDVDYSSSSSTSSGIVSSSTAGKEYLDDGGSTFGEYSNNYKTVGSSNNDCLAYRRPWATPPTACSESSKLQIGGAVSKKVQKCG